MAVTTVAVPPITNRHRLRLPSIGRLTLLDSGGVLLLVLIFAAAILGPVLWRFDPLAQQIADRLQLPTAAHPFGTDAFGRDLLSRILWGARWSLTGATVACLGTSLLGFLVASVSVFGGRHLDAMLSRLVEALMAIPALVTALAFSSLLGPSLHNLLLALILTSWPWYARAFRSLLLKEETMLFVEAAHALGAPQRRIVLRHILPNVLGPAIVLATGNFGSVILNLAGLSFLGLGIQPPTPEWGDMINEARAYFQVFPWQMVVPGLCITATVLAVNLTGDAIRDAFDPRVRRR
jgi:ABC-type dipeptide/oligopeptide/nickel transport system permease subunit